MLPQYLLTNFDDLFTTIKYPAGEVHVSLTGNLDDLLLTRVIAVIVRDFNDLLIMVTANDILKRQFPHKIRWFVPYFPFARHDRRRDQNDGLELSVAMKAVEGLDIVIADPHSDVVGQLPHIPQKQSVNVFDKFLFNRNDPVVFIIPDQGATKKAYTWLKPSDRVIQAHKVRDPGTGSLSGFSVDPGDLMHAHCIVVDDICDGGGTFIGLAKLLKGRGAIKCTLAVTHGLFTKGFDKLADHFDEIGHFGCVSQLTTKRYYGNYRTTVYTFPYTYLFNPKTIV